MTIPSSGQSLSFSALRTEFVGGSSAISLSDLYRGGSNIIKKAGDNQATNDAASIATSGALDVSDFYDQGKGFTFTYSTSFLSGASGTDQNASDLFGDDYDVNYPKNIVIPSGITLGSNNTSEYGLEIDAGGTGTITITNNGSIIGAGGAGGSAGSANGGTGGSGGAGGDALKFHVPATIVNNGSIFGGGGGGAGGGGGGQGGALQQQQQTTAQQGPMNHAQAFDDTRWRSTDGQQSMQASVGNPPNFNGYFVQRGGAGGPYSQPTPFSQFTQGQYTYVRGPQDQGSPHQGQQFWLWYRTYPQSQQQQTAGHAGGAGGAGGLGRGFNNQPGADSGASGSSGSTGSAGDGGAGGAGAAGGGYGTAGTAGSAGSAGTNSTTSGSSGGSAGSVGAAGAAWERESGVTITSQNSGTITGAAPTSD